ncbi:MAG: hypothetical protein AAFZ65_03505 [Planctomycetota bacterium]
MTDVPTEPSDLERAALGDGAAIRRVVERTGPWVNSLVRARTGEQRDVVVAIYERLWRECVEYDPRVESELVFVARLARRELASRGLRTAPNAAPAADDFERGATSGASDMPCQESERLAPFLARLSTEQMNLLRAALHKGRDAAADVSARAKSDQRDQLRSLLMEARRSMRTPVENGEGLR